MTKAKQPLAKMAEFISDPLQHDATIVKGVGWPNRENQLRFGERSERGVAFNSLSTYVDYRRDQSFYADTGELFRFCKQEISPHVSLLHDHPMWEWTIGIRRSE